MIKLLLNFELTSFEIRGLDLNPKFFYTFESKISTAPSLIKAPKKYWTKIEHALTQFAKSSKFIALFYKRKAFFVFVMLENSDYADYGDLIFVEKLKFGSLRN